MRPVVSGELEATFAANLSEREAEELTATLVRIQGAACGTR